MLFYFGCLFYERIVCNTILLIRYFDEVTYTQSRAQIHESLSKLAGSVGVSPEEFLKLLRVGDADNPRNYGNGVTAEL